MSSFFPVISSAARWIFKPGQVTLTVRFVALFGQFDDQRIPVAESVVNISTGKQPDPPGLAQAPVTSGADAEANSAGSNELTDGWRRMTPPP